MWETQRDGIEIYLEVNGERGGVWKRHDDNEIGLGSDVIRKPESDHRCIT